jgi:pyrimidine operon attenuation protein / uracil phosphoribosyltransferase
MGTTENRRTILSPQEIDRILNRLASEILEKNPDLATLVLIGMRTGGILLARMLQDKIKSSEGIELPIGVLDITLYRDDITTTNQHHFVRKTEIPFSLNGKDVVLVDDVLFTGRSTRAALDAMMDHGRPKTVRLAVLIDRGQRELPIRPDFVGKDVTVFPDESVEVLFDEKGVVRGAVVEKRKQ